MTPEELAAHEARHQPTRRGAVCRTCEVLWPCPSQRASSALREAWAANDRLGAMVEWLAEVIVDARDACQRAESIEPMGSPEWVESGIAMRTTVLREVRKVLDRERTAHPSALDRVTRERDEAWADRDEWKDNAITLRGLLDNHAHNDEAMNAALLAVTAERDEARAEVERLDRDGRAVAGRCLHHEARATQAEAAIERVRVIIRAQEYEHNGYEVPAVSTDALRAALDGEAS